MENILKNLFNNGVNNLLKNKFDEAEKIFLLILKKGYVEKLYYFLGYTYLKKLYYFKAQTYFEKSIQRNESIIESYFNIGLSYEADHEKSIYYLEKLIKKFQKNNFIENKTFNISMFYQKLAKIYKYIGDYINSEKYVYKSLEYNKLTINSLYILSTFSNVNKNNNYHQLIQSYVSKIPNIIKKLDNQEIACLYYILGKAEDELGNYRKSFNYYKRGNFYKNLVFKKWFITPDYEKRKKYLFEKYEFENKLTNKNYPQVIFIVGLPRSGSTLVETILNCNINTKSLGEYAKITDTLKYNNLDIYFNNLEQYDILIDKQLANFQNIPFLINNFNNCKIINMIRNPLDNILSIYTTFLEETSLYNSATLEDIFKYFIFWKEVMKYWKSKYNDKIYDCYYDRMVIDPTENIKKLIKFVDFEWDDKYLNHHLFKQKVNTSSNFQVKQKIYKTSLNKWEKYQEFLKPIIKKFDENSIF